MSVYVLISIAVYVPLSLRITDGVLWILGFGIEADVGG